jgi:hypothetical protein
VVDRPPGLFCFLEGKVAPMHAWKMAFPLAAGLFLVGCGSSAEVSLVDQGSICLVPAGPERSSGDTSPATYVANQAVTVVMSATCLSGMCTSKASASCSVKMLEGSMFKVTSRATFKVESDSKCTSGCTVVTAHCKTGNLPPGSYLFQHGDEQVTLEVPSTVIPPCTRGSL